MPLQGLPDTTTPTDGANDVIARAVRVANDVQHEAHGTHMKHML